MATDSRGLAVSHATAESLAAIDDFSRRLLCMAAGAGAVLAAAERHREVPMLQLQAAVAHLFAQTRAGDEAAAQLLARADALHAASNPREQLLAAALRDWQRHEFSSAVARLEALTESWPADLPSAKLAEFLYYVLGQQHEAERFRRHVERLALQQPDDPDLLSMLAFARELTGDADAAEATAERALALAPGTPWAHHALSHAWMRRGEVEPAIARLSAALPIWERSDRAIWSHNAWHLALHHLERLDGAAARELFDGAIWRADEDSAGIALDAISLHWRAELAGLELAPPWQAMADRVAPRAAECFMPFASAHLAYALARAGEAGPERALLGAVRAEAERDGVDARRAWSRVGCAVVEASSALGAGDSARCATLLDPVMAEVTIVGGSDAQCDLFRLSYARALGECGRRSDARAYLTSMWGGSPRTPLEQRWLASVR